MKERIKTKIEKDVKFVLLCCRAKELDALYLQYVIAECTKLSITIILCTIEGLSSTQARYATSLGVDSIIQYRDAIEMSADDIKKSPSTSLVNSDGEGSQTLEKGFKHLGILWFVLGDWPLKGRVARLRRQYRHHPTLQTLFVHVLENDLIASKIEDFFKKSLDYLLCVVVELNVRTADNEKIEDDLKEMNTLIGMIVHGAMRNNASWLHSTTASKHVPRIIPYVHNAGTFEVSLRRSLMSYGDPVPWFHHSSLDKDQDTRAIYLPTHLAHGVKVHTTESDLKRALERASVHWLWESHEAESHDIRPYSAPLCMEIERAYLDGHSRHVRVENEPVKKIRINLNTMVEEEEEKVEGTNAKKTYRSVHRFPDHFDVASEVEKHGGNLIESIRKGECVLFVGSGFGVPANLPSWAQLLKRVSKERKEVSDGSHKAGEKRESRREQRRKQDLAKEVRRLLESNNHSDFEMVAQIEDDRFPAEMKETIAKRLEKIPEQTFYPKDPGSKTPFRNQDVWEANELISRVSDFDNNYNAVGNRGNKFSLKEHNRLRLAKAFLDQLRDLSWYVSVVCVCVCVSVLCVCVCVCVSVCVC